MCEVEIEAIFMRASMTLRCSIVVYFVYNVLKLGIKRERGSAGWWISGDLV